MVRVMPFMTADLVVFERRTNLPSISEEMRGESQQ
jgi:hypothetical protein